MGKESLSDGEVCGLFKIRMETGGEILIRIRNDDPFPGVTLNVQWHGNKLAKEEYLRFDDMDWVSAGG